MAQDSCIIGSIRFIGLCSFKKTQVKIDIEALRIRIRDLIEIKIEVIRFILERFL